jgi:hypothetical protein
MTRSEKDLKIENGAKRRKNQRIITGSQRIAVLSNPKERGQSTRQTKLEQTLKN